MKYITLLSLACILGAGSASATTVRGYHKKNGTYVASHHRNAAHHHSTKSKKH